MMRSLDYPHCFLGFSAFHLGSSFYLFCTLIPILFHSSPFHHAHSLIADSFISHRSSLHAQWTQSLDWVQSACASRAPTSSVSDRASAHTCCDQRPSRHTSTCGGWRTIRSTGSGAGRLFRYAALLAFLAHRSRLHSLFIYWIQGYYCLPSFLLFVFSGYITISSCLAFLLYHLEPRLENFCLCRLEPKSIKIEPPLQVLLKFSHKEIPQIS